MSCGRNHFQHLDCSLVIRRMHFHEYADFKEKHFLGANTDIERKSIRSRQHRIDRNYNWAHIAFLVDNMIVICLKRMCKTN